MCASRGAGSPGASPTLGRVPLLGGRARTQTHGPAGRAPPARRRGLSCALKRHPSREPQAEAERNEDHELADRRERMPHRRGHCGDRCRESWLTGFPLGAGEASAAPPYGRVAWSQIPGIRGFPRGIGQQGRTAWRQGGQFVEWTCASSRGGATIRAWRTGSARRWRASPPGCGRRSGTCRSGRRGFGRSVVCCEQFGKGCGDLVDLLERVNVGALFDAEGVDDRAEVGFDAVELGA
jgi:hypothetical protein